ncbi:hypothetical protein [Streptomyces sp. S.PNR 29]|uniref:hypothetical protein n=1 Tax=Streptomyces sp. S.PNR 29 TaxID=2973805 RepID=UPI0025B1AFF7|nr:hypothetical protein [Streptomyces sp. S.PNR 29]MDN0198102.1 hypothetical protein [Streptomyces sp. S.PNR 29]
MLSTSDPDSVMSRLADDFEDAQMAMGADVVKEASAVLGNPLSTHSEVRYIALRLSECLSDALRIAESRGLRLPVPIASEDDDSDAEVPA